MKTRVENFGPVTFVKEDTLAEKTFLILGWKAKKIGAIDAKDSHELTKVKDKNVPSSQGM